MMGIVKAAMTYPAQPLVVCDFMVADEMKDFVGQSIASCSEGSEAMMVVSG